MEAWRILLLRIDDAFTNMAIDEAILESRVRKIVPNTLRFYRWKPSAVSIGRFQSADKEVNLDTCKRLGVDMIRRISGGGAVYHDFSGELTYSVVVDCENRKITDDVTTSYEGICSGILRGLGLLGLEVELEAIDPSQRCPNILIKGRKVSGNAQARRSGILLQHGTILLDLDVETMLAVLRNPKLVMNESVQEFVRDRITTLRRELDRKIEFEEVAGSLRRGFSEAFHVNLIEGDLTETEVTLAEELKATKYRSHAWNYGAQESSEKVGSCYRHGQTLDSS